MKRFLAVLLLALACTSETKTPIADSEQANAKPAPPPPPAAQQARELIMSSADFGEYEFTNAAYTLPVSGAAMNDPQRAAAKELAAAGWLAIDGAGDISLTDKSRSDRRFLLRENGLLDIVPLATKEMGEVTGVRQNADGTVMVDFTWRWKPNEVGAAFRTGLVADRYATPQDGRATLMWDGSAWTILKIE